MHITKWAKDTNQFVKGLNYSFNGEDYDYNLIHYTENKAIANISVTRHLFAEGDFVHLTMTLGLRIILDTIANYLENKYLCKLESLQIIELRSVNIYRISHLAEILTTIEEVNCRLLSDNYSGSFMVAFGGEKMVFDVSVSCIIKRETIALTRSKNIKSCFDNYRIDIQNILVNKNQSTAIPQVFKNDQECRLDDVPFPIVFNLLINHLFIYCSHDSGLKGSRYILATSMCITRNTDTQLSSPIYLVMNNKKNVKSRILYETLLKDECSALNFKMEFLYQVN